MKTRLHLGKYAIKNASAEQIKKWIAQITPPVNEEETQLLKKLKNKQ